jgi:hypothetical protein
MKYSRFRGKTRFYYEWLWIVLPLFAVSMIFLFIYSKRYSESGREILSVTELFVLAVFFYGYAGVISMKKWRILYNMKVRRKYLKFRRKYKRVRDIPRIKVINERGRDLSIIYSIIVIIMIIVTGKELLIIGGGVLMILISCAFLCHMLILKRKSRIIQK